MPSCAWCQESASATIPVPPGRVCVTHAIEFWTAFLTFARETRVEVAEVKESSATGLRRGSEPITRRGSRGGQ